VSGQACLHGSSQCVLSPACVCRFSLSASSSVEKIVRALFITTWSYVAPAENLSGVDMHSACQSHHNMMRSLSLAFCGAHSLVLGVVSSGGLEGGERYLPDGYCQIPEKLYEMAAERARRPNPTCSIQLLTSHTVKIIEQCATDSNSAPFALVHCPDQRVVVLARTVVCTASVGLMQSSIAHQSNLQQRYGGRLQSALASPIKLSSNKPQQPPSVEEQAAILFHPPLSAPKCKAFKKLGMGLENKVHAAEHLPTRR
jgi:hypothetical protein